MLESGFKKKFREEVVDLLSELELDLDFYHNKGNARSGPDMIILGPVVWAVLEFKRSETADTQPNQPHHVARLNSKGFARFVYPENANHVLEALYKYFSHGKLLQALGTNEGYD